MFMQGKDKIQYSAALLPFVLGHGHPLLQSHLKEGPPAPFYGGDSDLFGSFFSCRLLALEW